MAHWSKTRLGNYSEIVFLLLLLLHLVLSKRRKIQPKRRRLRRTSSVSAWPPTRLGRWRISGVSTLNLGLNLSQYTTNLYVHRSAQSCLGGVQQMAYNHLSIPAMSAECE